MAVKTFSKKTQGDVKLSTNFKVREFACNDGSDKVLIDVDLVAFLQKIRDKFGKPVVITSAYRTASYNKKVGGASGSYHTYGQAVDFYVQGVDPAEVAKYAESIGVKGVGLYTAQKFVHIDTRNTKYFWKNSGGGNVTVSTHGGAVKAPVAKSDNPCADWDVYIKAVQAAVGAGVDGIAGLRTLAACPTLRRGAYHKALIAVQNRLNYIGHDCGKADGIFGAKTEAAVKEFQRANGLTADGILGQNTWKKLLGIK